MNLPRCRKGEDGKHGTVDQSVGSVLASISFGNSTASLRCKARSRRVAKSCAVIDVRATICCGVSCTCPRYAICNNGNAMMPSGNSGPCC
jgi:hypothetical protein